jgi:hypothetical protein
MGDGFEMGQALGNALSNAVTKGVADWKAIQLDKQQRKEFDGAMQLAAQRRAMIQSASGVEELSMLKELKAQIQRSPGAQQVGRPTGNVQDDGSPETEQVIRTAEGDIPVGQLLILKGRQQQAQSAAELAEVDLIMELQSRYPENRYIKQWVASTYTGIQQKQKVRSKQIEAQRLQLDTLQAQLQREQFDQELRKYDEQPGREEAKEKFQTDERIRSDAARIEAEKKADIEVEGVRAQNRPERPATEFVKKLQQMAPRALESYQVLEGLDANRASLGQSAQSMLPNFAKSGKRQQFDQAQTEFVTSVLRAESGATITEAEVNRDIKKYFPVLGDSPETISQKRQARKTALINLYKAAELEPPDLGGQGADPEAGGGWDAQGIRQAYKAGKLDKNQAREMLRKLGQ